MKQNSRRRFLESRILTSDGSDSADGPNPLGKTQRQVTSPYEIPDALKMSLMRARPGQTLSLAASRSGGFHPDKSPDSPPYFRQAGLRRVSRSPSPLKLLARSPNPRSPHFTTPHLKSSRQPYFRQALQSIRSPAREVLASSRFETLEAFFADEVERCRIEGDFLRKCLNAWVNYTQRKNKAQLAHDWLILHLERQAQNRAWHQWKFTRILWKVWKTTGSSILRRWKSQVFLRKLVRKQVALQKCVLHRWRVQVAYTKAREILLVSRKLRIFQEIRAVQALLISQRRADFEYELSVLQTRENQNSQVKGFVHHRTLAFQRDFIHMLNEQVKHSREARTFYEWSLYFRGFRGLWLSVQLKISELKVARQVLLEWRLHTQVVQQLTIQVGQTYEAHMWSTSFRAWRTFITRRKKARSLGRHHVLLLKWRRKTDP